MKKLIIILWVIAGVVISYVGVGYAVLFRPISMPEYVYTEQEKHETLLLLGREFDYDIYELNKYDYKHLIEEQIQNKLYVYREKPMDEYDGLTQPLIRTITIDEDLEGFDYCIAFTHEMIHLKTFSGNERYVSTQTFKFLYENEEPHLRNVGIRYGYELMKGYYYGIYDIRDWVINYLKEIDCERELF